MTSAADLIFDSSGFVVVVGNTGGFLDSSQAFLVTEFEKGAASPDDERLCGGGRPVSELPDNSFSKAVVCVLDFLPFDLGTSLESDCAALGAVESLGADAGAL